MARIEKAVILAAGEGQRLRPFTVGKPKVMIPIANKPILQYVIEALVGAGIRSVTIVVGYKKEKIQDYFGSGSAFGLEVRYVEQKQQLGTAHALKQAGDIAGERFLVLSGDNIVESQTISGLLETQTPGVLVKEQENLSKYGAVVAQEGRLREIVEKPEKTETSLANTGIYVFDKSIFRLLEDQNDLPAVINEMLRQGAILRAYEAEGVWLDVVYPWDILKLNAIALGKLTAVTSGRIESGVVINGKVSIGKGALVKPNCYIAGPAAIGENCEIGPNVCILPFTSIGNNVRIAPFSQIENSVIANNVQIGSNSSVVDSVLDGNCTIGGHFIASSDEVELKVDNEYHKVRIGAMVGEYGSVADGVILRPGAVLGNHSRVRSLKVIDQSLPDWSLVV